MAAAEAELRRALQMAGLRVADQGLLSQLGGAAALHGLAPKELASRLGAHMLNQGSGMAGTLSAPAVEHFLSALARECGKAVLAAGAGGATPAAKRGARDWAGLTDTLGRPDQQHATTPVAARTPAAAAAAAAKPGGPPTPQSAPRSAFRARSNIGQVVSTLNAHVPRASSSSSSDGGGIVHAVPRGAQLPARHLYMLERLEDKVAAVNRRIAQFHGWVTSALNKQAPAGAGAAAGAAAAAGAGPAGAGPAAAGAGGSSEQQQQQQHHQLELAPVGVPVQEESLFAGRVVCEVEGGQLNEASVVLEGDTAGSEGARAHLDLSRLPSGYRVFPGQTVAVRGVNPTGGRILASALWTHAPPPPAAAAAAAAAAAGGAAPMDVDAAGGHGGGLTAVVAAGPFCAADDAALAYEPLHELLTQLRAAPPDLLVLLGPFVDAEQPLIAGGMIDVTFGALFREQVLARLQAWQAALPAPCQVVLLPAVRDAFHHPTFPQPAIDLGAAADPHLTSLQNPCTFAAGPATLAAVTTDVLRPLSAAELAKQPAGAPAPDRLAALASHVLGQRRFLPLYPPPPGSCLDLTADAAQALPVLPDLLLLPSDLAPFAKLVAAAPAGRDGGAFAPAAGADGSSAPPPQVVAINPGRLTKGSGGGTYAHVTVAGGSGPLSGRTRVDIVRV